MSGMTAEQIAELVAQSVATAMATNVTADDAVTTKVLANAPRPRTQQAAQGTAAKAAAIHRKLDPRDVVVDDSLTFRVSPVSGGGSLYSNGSRVVPLIEGKAAKSLDVGMLRALKGEGVIDKLIAFVESCDKDAKVGAHKPAPVAS